MTSVRMQLVVDVAGDAIDHSLHVSILPRIERARRPFLVAECRTLRHLFHFFSVSGAHVSNATRIRSDSILM